MISMPTVSNSMSLSTGNGSCNRDFAARNTEENAQPGQYITVEDPAHGIKYVYLVIGKHFKMLISCADMENTKDKKAQDGNNKAQNANNNKAPEQEQIQLKDDPYIGNTQSFLAQQNQKKISFRGNLVEKLRIMEQSALLDKSATEKFDAKG
jgi:hypothetical protein